MVSYLDYDDSNHSKEDDEEEEHDASVRCNLQRRVGKGFRLRTRIQWFDSCNSIESEGARTES